MTQTEVDVCVDFRCHACGGAIHMVARCKGALLTLTTKVDCRTVIACPNCGDRIDLTFDADGEVKDVSPCEDTLPQPSLN
jgi:hypothetical protein